MENIKINKIIYVFTLSIIFGCIMISGNIAKAETFPNFPMAFWGSVTIDGNLAPIGTVIRSYYGTTLAGQVVVQEPGIYGYTEATKQKLLVAEGTGQIIFKFQQSSLNSGIETDGTTQQTYAAFESGVTKPNFNLAFTLLTPPVVPSPAPVSSGGGGGGGGGGSYAPLITATSTSSTSTLSAATQKVDINKDGKVDVLEFVSLMADWGKTGSNNVSDFNNDGKVDVLDFVMLMANWTK